MHNFVHIINDALNTIFLEHAFREFVYICILAKIHTLGLYVHFSVDYILDEIVILIEMRILEWTFADYICICILVTMYIFWRKCVFGETHLYLHFGCNAHILEYVRAFERSYLNLHFGFNIQLFWRICTLKYNYIHMFTGEITIIKHYYNLYHILSKIEETKTNFASWMLELQLNSITSYLK